MANREPLVIKAKQMQNGRVEIVDVNGIFHDVVGEVVRFAIDLAWSRTATTHPHGEAARMVVPAIILHADATLGVDRPAKLSAPDNEGFVQ